MMICDCACHRGLVHLVLYDTVCLSICASLPFHLCKPVLWPVELPTVCKPSCLLTLSLPRELPHLRLYVLYHMPAIIHFLVHFVGAHTQSAGQPCSVTSHLKATSVQTVANLGTISAVNLKGPGASDSWTAMSNTYGAAWEVSNQPSYPISLEVTSGSQTVSSSS